MTSIRTAIFSLGLFCSSLLTATPSDYWTTPAVFPPSITDSNVPVVSYNSTLNKAIAIWRNSGDASIYASLFDGATVTWSTAVQLGNGRSLSLDTTDDGTNLYAIAVWVDATSSALTYSAYHGATWSELAWTAATTVPFTNPASDFQATQISINNHGPAIITYADNAGTPKAWAIVNTTALGGSWPIWTTPTQLSTGNRAFAPKLSLQKVTSTSTFHALVTWLEGFSNSNAEIYANDYDSTSGWGTRTRLMAAASPQYTQLPSVAIDPQSVSGVVAWAYGTDGSTYTAHTSAFSGGHWSSTASIILTNVDLSPAPAMVNQIPFIAVKDLGASNVVKIYSGTFTPGVSPTLAWSSSPSFTSTTQGTPYISVAPGNSSNIMAYWSAISNTIGTSLYNGTSWGTEIDIVNTNTVGGTPSICIGYDTVHSLAKGVGVYPAQVSTQNLSYSLFNIGTPPPPPSPPTPTPTPTPSPSANERSYKRPSNRRPPQTFL